MSGSRRRATRVTKASIRRATHRKIKIAVPTRTDSHRRTKSTGIPALLTIWEDPVATTTVVHRPATRTEVIRPATRVGRTAIAMTMTMTFKAIQRATVLVIQAAPATNRSTRVAISHSQAAAAILHRIRLRPRVRTETKWATAQARHLPVVLRTDPAVTIPRTRLDRTRRTMTTKLRNVLDVGGTRVASSCLMRIT